MKTPRFPVGLSFDKKRFPKAKEVTNYTIVDIYTTCNSAGEVMRIEYVVVYEFLGSKLSDFMCDTTIARSMSNEQLAQYL